MSYCYGSVGTCLTPHGVGILTIAFFLLFSIYKTFFYFIFFILNNFVFFPTLINTKCSVHVWATVKNISQVDSGRNRTTFWLLDRRHTTRLSRLKYRDGPSVSTGVWCHQSFGGDFKQSVPCIGEKYPMHVKEPTSLLAKSREKSRWSGQTAQTGSYIRVVRPTGHSYITFRHPGRPGDCQIINNNNVDPSRFTLEGYITVRCLRTTSTRHLNMPYERRLDHRDCPMARAGSDSHNGSRYCID